MLKGAGTALYGSDAVAATVNVLSNDPSKQDGWSIQPEFGSDGWAKIRVSGGTKAGKDGSLGVDVSHAQSDGWRDHTNHTRDELNVTHFGIVDEDNTLKTILSFNKSDAEMAGSLIGLDALENNPESVGDIATKLDEGVEVKRKFDFARLSTEWDHFVSDDTRLNTIAYLRSNRNRYVATWENNLPQNDSQQKTLGVMFKVDSQSGPLHTIAGFDTEFTQANQKYVQLFDYVPTGRGSPVSAGEIYNYDVDYFAFAPYGRVEFDMSDALQLNAGLRFDTNRYEYTNNLADGAYGDSSYARVSSDHDTDFSHLSPKLGLSYKLADNQMAYLRYANGFRIPQATRLYSAKTDSADFELDPETTDTFELGYKFGSDSSGVDVAIYDMSIDDTIVRRENEAGERYYVNGGETTHRGIELGLQKKVNASVATKLSWSYSKHKFVDDPQYGNNEQAAAPNTIANLRLFYMPQAVTGLTTMVEVEHVGDYWLDSKNTRTYKGHELYNLKLSYKPGKVWSIYAKANNITDETYAESARLSYGKEKYTPGSPRQIFAGFEYQFK